MKRNELDHIDYEILKMLQENARVPLKEIAERVYLSSPAVSARIETLMKKGYIEGFHAQINPQVMGYHIKAFINLEVTPQDKKQFYPFIKECKNVVECNCVWQNQYSDRIFHFRRASRAYYRLMVCGISVTMVM